MTPGEFILWGSLLLLGLGGSAMCSGLETGLYSFNRARIALRSPREARARLLEREAGRTDRAIATLLISNNIFNYVGVLGMTALLEATALAEWQVIVLNAAIVTPVLLVLAESTPKELFRRGADLLTPALSPVLFGLRLVLTACGALPIVMLIARAAGRLSGLPAEAEIGLRQSLADMLKQDDSAMSEQQAALIDRALAFRRALVEEEMTPWDRVARVERTWDRARVEHAALSCGRRRMPVVDANGKVVGVLDTLELFMDRSRELSALIRPVPRTGGRTPAREALAMLRDAQARMIVVESRGRAIGIATAKDLVEPLTGELLAW